MKLVTGDIFEDDATGIVIPTNCIGPFGNGLALQARHKWPWLEREYKAVCQRGMEPGRIEGWPYARRGKAIDSLIWCAATKNHWRDPSRIEWIESICETLPYVAPLSDGFSLCVPALGCGLGGLDWADVLPIMERHFKDIDVRVYAPREDR